MAFISYNDVFNGMGPVSFFHGYEILSPESFSIAHPIEHMMTRNRATFARYLADQLILKVHVGLDILRKNYGAGIVHHWPFVPRVVGILGHNMNTELSNITVRWEYNTGGGFDEETRFIVGEQDEDLKQEIFRNRTTRAGGFAQADGDLPISVTITINNNTADYIDIGRLWVGGLWDIGSKADGTLNDTTIAGRFAPGYVQGAKSDLTRGNQSFTNRQPPFKSLDVTLMTDDEIQIIGEDVVPIKNTHSIQNFTRHLMSGGECIVVPRETSLSGMVDNDHNNAKWMNRVGVYGESGTNNLNFPKVGATEFRGSYKLRELL